MIQVWPTRPPWCCWFFFANCLCCWSPNNASCICRALKEHEFSVKMCTVVFDGPAAASESAVDSIACNVLESSVTVVGGQDRLSFSSTGHPSAIWKAWQVLLRSLSALAFCSTCWNSTWETAYELSVTCNQYTHPFISDHEQKVNMKTSPRIILKNLPEFCDATPQG